jgi:hypothetical protein
MRRKVQGPVFRGRMQGRPHPQVLEMVREGEVNRKEPWGMNPLTRDSKIAISASMFSEGLGLYRFSMSL